MPVDMITNHFNSLDLDIRKKPQGYSRFVDQKITPDVLAFISDCVISYVGQAGFQASFSTKDLLQFDYFIKNTEAVFAKPSPRDHRASSEYDKFVAQPLKTLAFAKILDETVIAGKNWYQIGNLPILEFIAQNERNSLKFLVAYFEKVLTDSGFIDYFNSYKNACLVGTYTEENLLALRGQFRKFMLGFTNITKDLEIYRIFPKVLNPLATFYAIPGIEKGRITQGRFIYSDLMYNRTNFRDIAKEKTNTRIEAAEKGQQTIAINYRVARAKSIIRRNHASSEVQDRYAIGKATQVHHIFPQHLFPELSDYVENLILLTPQQHNTLAHLDNKTTQTNPEYQKECLLSKLESIRQSLKVGKLTYSKERFIHVVNTGYGLSLPTSASWEEISLAIRGR